MTDDRELALDRLAARADDDVDRDMGADEERLLKEEPTGAIVGMCVFSVCFAGGLHVLAAFRWLAFGVPMDCQWP